MVIKYHLPHIPTQIPPDHAPFIEALRILNHHEPPIPYVILGGTLIGLIRDGEPVPTDTDYDITLLDTNPELIKSLFAHWPLAVSNEVNSQINQLVYWPNKTTVDFHFYRSTSTPNIYECFHQAGRITLELPEIEPLLWRDTIVRIPSSPFLYLGSKYPGWRIPQHRKKGNYSRKAITFGCFDPFHYGHLNLIRNCQKQSTDLTVIVRTDKHIRTYKHREPFFPEEIRLEQMKAFGKALLSNDLEPEDWIAKLKADIIFVENPSLQYSCITIPIPRTPNISSTQIRNK